MKTQKHLLAIALVTIFSSSAFADSLDTTIQSKAQLAATCELSTTNVDFSFTPTSTATYLKKNSVLTSICSNGVTYNMNLSSGSSGNAADRTMVSSTGELLHYNFYTSGLFERGGSFATPAQNYSGFTGNGSINTRNFFGGLLTNQFVTPGTYSDLLTATFTY